MREWERETHNDRGTERERIRQRQTETGRDRDRQRQRESDTERKGEAIGKERLRETENPKIRLHFKNDVVCRHNHLALPSLAEHIYNTVTEHPFIH